MKNRYNNKIPDDVDFAFLALHGKFGEDGCVQSVLETRDIPYYGCGPLSSAMCMDKNISKKYVKHPNTNSRLDYS